MLWLLEYGVFGEGHPLAHGIIEAGDNVLPWSSGLRPPKGLVGPVVFHGSHNEAVVAGRFPFHAQLESKSGCNEAGHLVR